jgi:branched-chain amino acid transport system permease protein
MSYFFQLVVSGIVVGSIYALSALGFVLIYKSSKVLNIAHGQIIAAGAFIAMPYRLGGHSHFPLLPAEYGHYLFPGHERGADLFAPADRRADHLGHHGDHRADVHPRRHHLLDALRFRQLFFSPISASNPISFGGVSISWTQLVGVIITSVMIGGFSWFFKKSTLGISMRAVIGRPVCLHVHRHFGAPGCSGWPGPPAGLSAAAAGGIIGNITGLNFETLQAFGITVFPVVILGGLDSIFGAVVAGIIMGLIQQFASGYLDGNWGLNGTAEVLPYIILLVILLFKPHGLFGIHEIERV